MHRAFREELERMKLQLLQSLMQQQQLTNAAAAAIPANQHQHQPMRYHPVTAAVPGELNFRLIHFSKSLKIIFEIFENFEANRRMIIEKS